MDTALNAIGVGVVPPWSSGSAGLRLTVQAPCGGRSMTGAGCCGLSYSPLSLRKKRCQFFAADRTRQQYGEFRQQCAVLPRRNNNSRPASFIALQPPANRSLRTAMRYPSFANQWNLCFWPTTDFLAHTNVFPAYDPTQSAAGSRTLTVSVRSCNSAPFRTISAR